MGERVHADGRRAVETAAAAAPARTPAPAASRMLDLQQRAGNAAVVRLLRRAGTPAPASSATTQSARDWFGEEMERRWGVTDIRASTQDDQLADVARYGHGQQAPTSIAGWQAWEPAAASDLYADVLAGFDAVADKLGGIPPVRDIRFNATAYDNVGGVATAAPHEAASYGNGYVRINRKFETADWPLPESRSTAQVQAPLTTGGRSQSRRRIITHELCHGVWEQAGAADPAIFGAWSAAVGWSGGQLVQNGTPLDRDN